MKNLGILMNKLDSIESNIDDNKHLVEVLKSENRLSQSDKAAIRARILTELSRIGYDYFKMDPDEIILNQLYWNRGISKKQIQTALNMNNFQPKSKAKTVGCKRCRKPIILEKKHKNTGWGKGYNYKYNIYNPDHFCSTCLEEKKQEKKIEKLKQRTRMANYDVRYEELRTMPYHEYLQTYEWKTTAKSAYRRAGYKCQLCGAKNVRLNAHHNTYENRGNERSEDIMVLCEECHEKYSTKISGSLENGSSQY